MKFHNLQHIFFDLDHTLWDFDRNSGLAFTTIFEKNDIDVGLEVFLKTYTPINMNYWKLYRENKVTKADLRYGRLREAFNELKINVTDDQIEKLSIDYIDHLPNHNHLLEGTVELLEYLFPKYKLHIITNGFKEVQHLKLKNSGINNYFKTITTSEDVGVKKPDPQIFEAALQNAAAKVEESIMIGDNFEADVIGAQNFGMSAILYNYYNQKYPKKYLQVLKIKELEHWF